MKKRKPLRFTGFRILRGEGDIDLHFLGVGVGNGKQGWRMANRDGRERLGI
jgi:hypothetical protein